MARDDSREKIGARVDAEVYNKFKEFIKAETGQKRGVLGEHITYALEEYMGESASSGGFEGEDVSNEDILREIRAMREGESPDFLNNIEGGSHTHTDGEVVSESVTDSDSDSNYTNTSDGTEAKPGTATDVESEDTGDESPVDAYPVTNLTGDDIPDSEPGLKAPRKSKVAWTVNEVLSKFSGSNSGEFLFPTTEEDSGKVSFEFVVNQITDTWGVERDRTAVPLARKVTAELTVSTDEAGVPTDAIRAIEGGVYFVEESEPDLDKSMSRKERKNARMDPPEIEYIILGDVVDFARSELDCDRAGAGDNISYSYNTSDGVTRRLH